METELTKLAKWLKDSGLKVNKSKMELCLLIKKMLCYELHVGGARGAYGGYARGGRRNMSEVQCHGCGGYGHYVRYEDLEK